MDVLERSRRLAMFANLLKNASMALKVEEEMIEWHSEARKRVCLATADAEGTDEIAQLALFEGKEDEQGNS